MAYLLEIFKNQFALVDKRLTELENMKDTPITFPNYDETFTAISADIIASRKLTESVLFLRLEAHVKRVMTEQIALSNDEQGQLHTMIKVGLDDFKKEITNMIDDKINKAMSIMKMQMDSMKCADNIQDVASAKAITSTLDIVPDVVPDVVVTSVSLDNPLDILPDDFEIEIGHKKKSRPKKMT